ncbi:MAG TPA: hypothetical protein VN496_10700 [Burkholderiales bacterium]|jgi:hypothetical protein|nr:hypothetical protein [Burkholderiales bacterium]
MRNIILLCMALAMGACANAPRLSTDQQFEAYRMQLRGERDTGKITVVEEQEKLRDHFWQVYGKDPNSIGHFAFSVSLMRSVQAGSFPLEDADALIAAKEAEIFAMKMASRQRQADCTYDCPWN